METKQNYGDPLIKMINALSFDIEDWFQVHNYDSLIKKKEWDKCESRVENNTFKILNLLDEHKTKATFFVLGWIADKYPNLIKEISERSHEIGIHGYSHKLVYNLRLKEFEKEILKSKSTIEKIIKKKVIGHRAPSFSITKKCLWAFSILERCGIKYDSSIYPIHHPDYGIPDSQVKPYKYGKIAEFPLSTVKIFNKNIPVAGGGYFRTLPYWFTKWAIRKINQERPAVIYIHPWELDPNQPDLDVSPIRNLRQRIGLKTTEKKLNLLIEEFKFSTIKEVLKHLKLLR